MLNIRSIGQAVQKLSSGKENETFGCCDLALDPMTFTSELDEDMVVTYLHAKNYRRSIGQAAQKLSLGYTDRQMDRQTDRETGKTFIYPHTPAVKMAQN